MLYIIHGKDTLNDSHQDIDVITFSKQFEKYFSEMFPKIKERYKKMLKKYPTIRSIVTNGYSVSIGFQKLIMRKKKQIPALNEHNMNINEINNNNLTSKSTVKKVNKNIKNLEDEYPKVVTNNKKIFDEAMYEATELRSSEQYLDNFYVAGADPGN